jgi:hypothetical protein
VDEDQDLAGDVGPDEALDDPAVTDYRDYER